MMLCEKIHVRKATTTCFLGVFLCFFGMVCFQTEACAAATSVKDLQKKLKQEAKKAEERKASLTQLTETEKKVDAELVAIEKRIYVLEEGLNIHKKRLEELVIHDESERITYENLLAELQKTERAQTEALRLLWEITCKRTSLGSREMAEWAIIDREFTWSQALFYSLDEYRRQLDQQETALTAILGRREKISAEVRGHLEAVNKEKTALLKNRLAFSQRLTTLRKQKQTAEEELNTAMTLVESLNFQIEEKVGMIERQKGKLPWPVQGTVKQRYVLSGKSASKGLGIEVKGQKNVIAIAGGNIVHNEVMRGFGSVVIIQHGEEYYSLYAFLEKSPVSLGQNVQQGQSIGISGFNPRINANGIYFELRYKQKAINPELWLSPL